MSLNPIELNKLGNALLGVSTFTSNIVFWRGQGYFDESAELNPLVHTWSLAVEEQYYVLFPIFLILVWRFGKNRVFWLIVLFAATSLALSEWGWRNQATANFYLAPTRAWELLSGSIAAFVVQKYGVQSNNTLSLLGLAAVLFAIFAYNASTPFPSIYALVPVVGVVLLILFAGAETFSARLLSNKLLVGMGLISYSAYLWHQPLFAFTRINATELTLSLGTSVTLIIISILLAYLSWKYVERPFRNKNYVTSKTIAVLSVVSLIMLAGLGVISKSASKGYEISLAKQLSESQYVYFSNLNERKFIEARLSFPLASVNSVVIGSSRIMQVNSHMLEDSLLNFAVSGASIEDDIAFTGEAVAKLSPKRVFIGADPWLLNKFDGQDRWQPSEKQYHHWQEIINRQEKGNLTSLRFFSQASNQEPISFAKSLYENINFGSTRIAKNGNVEAFDKKAYDGSHIYNEKYLSTTQAKMEKQFDSLLNYAMNDFEFDDNAKSDLIELLNWLKFNGIEVSLVLSPYHPRQYEKIHTEKSTFMSLEDVFREIASELDIKILGSYNPQITGCEWNEFYDGMHPKESCMEKVFEKSRF